MKGNLAIYGFKWKDDDKEKIELMEFPCYMDSRPPFLKDIVTRIRIKMKILEGSILLSRVKS